MASANCHTIETNAASTSVLCAVRRYRQVSEYQREREKNAAPGQIAQKGDLIVLHEALIVGDELEKREM